MVVPLLAVPRTPRRRHVLAARLQGVRVRVVVFDAEDEPPGASADGAAPGFDSITHPFGV